MAQEKRQTALDQRAASVLEDVIRRRSAGESVSDSEVMASYPELMPVLREKLRALRAVEQAERRFERSRGGADATLSKLSGAPERSDATWDSARSAAGKFPRIEGYRIVGVLGQGGMGIVYRAVQTKLNRAVALKFLPAIIGSASASAVARFKREATAAARLHHTNIVPVYDFGECEDGYYYAMELVAGKPADQLVPRLAQANATHASAIAMAQILQRILSDGADAAPLDPPPEAHSSGSGRWMASPSGSSTSRGRTYFRHVARWMADVADALHYAHGEGIIHRDIKPANLILSTDGRMMVADFGLARCTDESSVTMTGSLIGTVRYLSPEQAMAKRMPLDHRTDVYSLGATMYELLCFQPAFPGTDDKQVLAAIVTRDPTVPRKILPAVPHELNTICMKTLEKSADERYATAEALANDLRRYLNDYPILAKPPSLVRRASKFVRRRRALVVAGLATVLLSLAMGYGLWQRAERRASEVEELLLTGRQIAETTRRWAAADANFVRASELDAENDRPILFRIWLRGQWADAVDEAEEVKLLEEMVALCDQVLHRSPQEVLALSYKGAALRRLGRVADAISTLESCLQLNDAPYDCYSNLGTSYAMNGDSEQAARYLKAGVAAIGPQEEREYAALAWHNLAVYQLFRGQPEAFGSIQKAIEEHLTDEAESYLLRALIRMNVAEYLDLDGAFGDARVALSLAEKPGKEGVLATALRVLATVNLRREEFEKAREHATQAMEHGDLATVDHLIEAVAEARLGHRTAARAAYERALAVWPDDLRSESDTRFTTGGGRLWFESGAKLAALRREVEGELEE